LQSFNRTRQLNADKSQSFDIWMITCYIDKLSHAIVGIENLKSTYVDDATFCSKLDIIIENIRQHLSSLE